MGRGTAVVRAAVTVRVGAGSQGLRRAEFRERKEAGPEQVTGCGFCTPGIESHSGPFGPFSEVVPIAGGNVASVRRKSTVKTKELKHALDLLVKVLANPKIGPCQKEQLLRAKRDLEDVLHSGKVDRQRVFRVVEVVATLLLESLEVEA